MQPHSSAVNCRQALYKLLASSKSVHKWHQAMHSKDNVPYKLLASSKSVHKWHQNMHSKQMHPTNCLQVARVSTNGIGRCIASTMHPGVKGSLERSAEIHHELLKL